jgi:hypothetical protein
MDSSPEPSLDSGADVGQVSGPGVSPSLGVDQISRLPGGDVFGGHGCLYGYRYWPSLGFGAVVGWVTVPEAFPGLQSSAAIPGILSGLVQSYFGPNSVPAFYGWDSFASESVHACSFPTTSVPSVQVSCSALSEHEPGIEEFPLVPVFAVVSSDCDPQTLCFKTYEPQTPEVLFSSHLKVVLVFA